MKHQLITNTKCIKLLDELDRLTLSEYCKNNGIYVPTRYSYADICKWAILKHNSKTVSQAPELKHFVRVGENGEILNNPKDLIPEGKSIVGVAKAWEKAGEDIIFEDSEIVNVRTFGKRKGIWVKNVCIFWRDSSSVYHLESQFKTIEDIIRATK